MNKLLQLPATISKINTMAKSSLRLQVDTQEALTPEQMQIIMANYDKYGWFCFMVDKNIEEKEVLELPALPKKDEAEKKSPSQRFHDRLFVYYKSSHTDTTKFRNFYEKTLDKLGQMYLDKVN